jgi:hypothetical protein
MTRRLVAAAAAAIALAGAARGEDAAPKPLRVAVDPLRTTSIATALAELVQDRLCAAVAERPQIEAICPADVAAAAALARSAVAFGACGSDDCLRRLDAYRTADRRITGALARGDGGLVLAVELVGPDGPGTRVIETLPEDLDALVTRLPAIVKKLFAAP